MPTNTASADPDNPGPTDPDQRTAQSEAGPEPGTVAEPDPDKVSNCHGDGKSGYRFLAIYAVAADKNGRYTRMRDTLRYWAARADNIYSEGGAPRIRDLRWVCNENGLIAIAKVKLSKEGDDSFGATMNELREKGYKWKSRKYLVWVDHHTKHCRGIANRYFDDSPGKGNYNNGQEPQFARIDITGDQGTSTRDCGNSSWLVGETEAHEIGHMLGAVQGSAPHSSKKVGGKAGHCFEEWDIMCYADEAQGVSESEIRWNCPGPAYDDLFLDCGRDDYWNVDPTLPAANTYLADKEEYETATCQQDPDRDGQEACHWNIAWSRFLVRKD